MNQTFSPNRDLVILLHGIMRSSFDLAPMSLYLKKQGYDAVNILYPSRSKNLEDLTAFVYEKISAHPKYAPHKTIHFVTHSMGGLIARYYIAKHNPQNLGKVVMLSPPNTGSEMADYLNAHKLLGSAYRKFFGLAGAQLTTTYQHPLQDIHYDLGVIAGSRSINPLACWALQGPHDGIVPVARTKIPGMRDHIVMPVTHGLMMFNPRVMAQAAHFLKSGKFKS